MSTTIYYFSSTGNSLDIAKCISKKINGDLVPMVQNQNMTCDSGVIGFVYPTYFWGLPNLVEEFVKTLKIDSKSPYIFAITLAKTSGGGLGSMNDLVRKKGLWLNYGKTVHSVSNYIVEYDINLNTVDKVTEKARKQAFLYSKDILMKKQNNCRKIPILTDAFHRIYIQRCGANDKGFLVLDACVGCRTCEKVCPVQNITVIDGKPRFHHHCEHCIACIHWCPMQAIQYKDKTAKRNRYHNPNIKQNELNK